MNAHSSILGGSNAARLLNCPRSYQESLKSEIADVPSVYADEGTYLHNQIAELAAGDGRAALDLSDVTPEHAAVLGTAFDALDDLKKLFGGRFRIKAIEESVAFPGVVGSFGTVDLVVANGSTVIVVDWKFGAGVAVHALYSDDEGDTINPQLAFYAICARAANPKLFKGKRIVLAIIQPRLDPPATYVETDNDELDQYQAALVSAYEQALGRDPHIARGDWCRFAKCKATCPLWVGAAFDLVDIDPLAASLAASASPVAAGTYPAFLAHALDLATLAEQWAAEIRRQAHVYMESGGAVPAWKLVPKRANRTWIDPTTVAGKLAEIGAMQADIFAPPEVRSVAQVEKALKARRIELPPHLWQAISSGTTIAPADDARQPLDRAGLLEGIKGFVDPADG